MKLQKVESGVVVGEKLHTARNGLEPDHLYGELGVKWRSGNVPSLGTGCMYFPRPASSTDYRKGQRGMLPSLDALCIYNVAV